MYIIKQNEYDLMMISLIKQDGTFVHNYHCTFYITVVDGNMYMYVPTQYIYMYILYIVYTVHVQYMYIYCIHNKYMYTCIYTCTYTAVF